MSDANRISILVRPYYRYNISQRTFQFKLVVRITVTNYSYVIIAVEERDVLSIEFDNSNDIDHKKELIKKIQELTIKSFVSQDNIVTICDEVVEVIKYQLKEFDFL